MEGSDPPNGNCDMMQIREHLGAKPFTGLREENWRRIYSILLLVSALFLRGLMHFFGLVLRKSSSLSNLVFGRRLKQKAIQCALII